MGQLGTAGAGAVEFGGGRRGTMGPRGGRELRVGGEGRGGDGGFGAGVLLVGMVVAAGRFGRDRMGQWRFVGLTIGRGGVLLGIWTLRWRTNAR